MQKFIEKISNLNNNINLSQYNNILVVCDKFLLESPVIKLLQSSNINIHFFTDFQANPKYEEVVKGINLFNSKQCELIIAIGGGSSIDVAKCIKAFAKLDSKKNYLEQEIIDDKTNLVAIPTTAGTGSESTHFAVVYYNNKKYSVASNYILPNYVVLDSQFLVSLPLYQKKSTMLDALCQGIESYWSVNSTDESKKYAKEAIKLVLKNYEQYIKQNESVYNDILKAANYSGRAINISKTTAPHAMSYKITSLYGISHGHAVALCLPFVWEYMIHNMNLTIDKRGKEYLNQIFNDLDKLFECQTHEQSVNKFKQILNKIDINCSNIVKEDDLNILTSSVNVERLSNNPVSLNKEEIKKIYMKLM